MKNTRHSITAGILGAALLFTFVIGLNPGKTLNAQSLDNEGEFVPGEVILQFNPGAKALQLADAIQRGALVIKEPLPARGRPARESGLVLALTRLPVAQALAALQNHPAVQYVEPNGIYRHQASFVSNDLNYTRGKLWGMYGDGTTPANQYGSQAGEAWKGGNIGSSDIYIGVIDEGIDISHPDLAANIGTNPGEIPGNGIDDDGNGYVDDVNGYDFFHNDNTVFDGGDADHCKDDHGTHVSGTIGAVGGNGIGVAGMCWNVKILSAKFLGPNGGTADGAVKAINYFINLKTRVNNPVNIVALNASWGGPSSTAIQEALIDAAKAGILFVAAAGNSHFFYAAYPARYDTTQPILLADGTTIPGADYDAVIAVGAIDTKGALASFSNYGVSTVDLGAPGVNVMSTVPGGRYSTWDGTSMATPHVTGACALYLASHSGALPWEIKSAILTSTTPTASLSGITVTGGRLNVGGFY